jgi:taurine dioxygenase
MLEVRPTGGALGADIMGADLARPLTSAEFGAIHGAWMRHLVLRFREQLLTDDQLMAFSRNFGALDGNPRHAKIEGREMPASAGYVNVISNVVENGRAIGGLGNYESKWHTDITPPGRSIAGRSGGALAIWCYGTIVARCTAAMSSTARRGG